MAIDKEQLWRSLAETGETSVRERLAQGVYAPERKRELIKEWLRQQESARLDAAIARTESREERAVLIADKAASEATEANSIARNALRVAKCERTIAIIAAIAAIVAAIVAVIALLR